MIDVTQGTLSSVDRIQQLAIYCSLTNGNGVLLFKDASINFDGNHHTNMGISTYPSVDGDSGTPIIYHHNGISELVGVHEGVVCILDSPSENQMRIDVTSYPNFCDTDNHIFYYKAFSAWENVKLLLDLR